MRKAGLSELSSTNMLVVLLIIGLVLLSNALDRQIQKVADLLSQAEATKPFEIRDRGRGACPASWSGSRDAHDT
ncbi:MAG: hypothetical protein JTT11_01355 [Candidatus Brockarchaeota archaeon]|nr:hypothetical protein [Candidatus Brockarchaeota archaeon]